MAFQNNSSFPVLNNTLAIACFFSESGIYIMFSVTAVLGFFIFPLYFLVLHTGFQRWRKNKRSTVSHTDFFTYNNVFFELLLFSSCCVVSRASLKSDMHLMITGLNILFFASPGLLSMHVLTCVERFLAVVYPVVYLSLKKHKWIWARNLVIVVIWAMCVLFLCVVWVLKQFNIASLCLLGIATSIVIICSVQVLHALKNPSPGEGQGVSKSKRKAFFTVSTILFALMMWLTWAIAFHILEKANVLEDDGMCKFRLFGSWFELPSSLVLPLLFLHRAGKLPKCRGKKENPG